MIKDFKKYKRLFAFGCSFTSYIYPTWVDILSKSMNPDIEFYNLGKSGGGNMFISARIVEANNKFKFNENDLIVVMWSTFCRIDFYKTERGWITPGNIYSQNELSEKVVKELEDFNYFLIRDFALIELATSYLENLPCDSIKLMSVPFDYESSMNFVKEDDLHYAIKNRYSELIAKYPKNMFEFFDRHWFQTIRYLDDGQENKDWTDYHPSPADYLRYLQFLNLPLDQKSIDYTNEAMNFLMRQQNNGKKVLRSEIIKNFKECDDRISQAYKVLW